LQQHYAGGVGAQSQSRSSFQLIPREGNKTNITGNTIIFSYILLFRPVTVMIPSSLHTPVLVKLVSYPHHTVLAFLVTLQARFAFAVFPGFETALQLPGV
jgi:hypothetical protein